FNLLHRCGPSDHWAGPHRSGGRQPTRRGSGTVSSRSASPSELSLLRTFLDRGAYRVAPLGPAAVVIPDAIVAEQIGEDEPGVRGPLADPAIRDDIVALAQTLLAFIDRA